YGRQFSAEEFFVTGSGMQAIQITLALTVGEGDEVLIPTPAWPNAAAAAGIIGARAVLLPMSIGNDGWTLDLVDAHAHLYDSGANRYGIFARKDPVFEAFVGDYSTLPTTYLLDDYLRATSSRKVDGLIWHEFISEDPIKEVTWAQQLAAASEVPIAL